MFNVTRLINAFTSNTRAKRLNFCLIRLGGKKIDAVSIIGAYGSFIVLCANYYTQEGENAELSNPDENADYCARRSPPLEDFSTCLAMSSGVL